MNDTTLPPTAPEARPPARAEAGIYQQYAAVYDASGQLGFSLRMIGYLERLLARHPTLPDADGPRTWMELACGTGTTAIALARRGWQVTAVDGSAAMLAQAVAKEGADCERITWQQGDMRTVRLRQPVSVASCLYDSLNYMLTSDDLLAVFRRVHDALLPGGLFLFDMNTAYALATFWDDETYFTDSPDLSVTMESSYDSAVQRTSVTVTCFQRVGELYRKIVETHTEQAYPEEQVATLLSDAGFGIEARYACFSFLASSRVTPRIMWLARRPGGPAELQSLLQSMHRTLEQE